MGRRQGSLTATARKSSATLQLALPRIDLLATHYSLLAYPTSHFHHLPPASAFRLTGHSTFNAQHSTPAEGWACPIPAFLISTFKWLGAGQLPAYAFQRTERSPLPLLPGSVGLPTRYPHHSSLVTRHSSLVTCHFSIRPARPKIGSMRQRGRPRVSARKRTEARVTFCSLSPVPPRPHPPPPVASAKISHHDDRFSAFVPHERIGGAQDPL